MLGGADEKWNRDSICDECNHPIEKHGPDGCTCDRKVFVDGIEIDGLCGCTAWTEEPE